MTGEDAFRGALLFLVLLSVAVAGYHRFQATRSGEQISRRGEGWLLFLAIRLSGVLLLAATVLYLAQKEWTRWASLPLPAALRGAGAALGLCSVLLLYWTLSTLGKNLTDTVAVRTNHTLVTHGPYRWVRHPYYLTTLLLVIACFLLAANWFIGLAGLLLFALLAVRTPLGEQQLVERFGDEYRVYMRRTGRFLPRWR